MTLTAQALRIAAGTLQQISESTPGERGRRASVVALVLQAIERLLVEPAEVEFLLRRADAAVEELVSAEEQNLLRRVLIAVLEEDEAVVPALLSDYATGLEEARRLAEAEAVIGLARSMAPQRADLALRAARLARLQGDRARALELYAAARDLDEADGSVARLAGIGEAVVSDDPEPALARAVRRSIRAGDGEAAAVGLEERGRVRRSAGDRNGAARDFAIAAVRYVDPVDRGRVAHQLADLYLAAGDSHAAREVLLFTLSTGDRSQREHAQARLHTVSRDLGDQLGMRRWRSFTRPTLVSLSSRPGAVAATSSASAVARWRDRVEARFAAATG